MIRKGDKLRTHLEGSFTVVGAPRIWDRDKQFILQSDETGEHRSLRSSELFNALQNNYFQHDVGRYDVSKVFDWLYRLRA